LFNQEQQQWSMTMKIITPIVLALSVLAGIASQATADENDGKSLNLHQMDRESRGGQSQ
jgi:hypothetical protein